MSSSIQIEKLVRNIQDNIQSPTRLRYEIEIYTIFLNNSITKLMTDKDFELSTKYLLTILKNSKLALDGFAERVKNLETLTFLELYSYYEIVANVTKAIDLYIGKGGSSWPFVYNISIEDSYEIIH